ncbi:MAG: GNAT family N-acetyltransferase [Alphaproteobacteria bacterium]|nr:GNAT family N-acetyltransferase [Alphaproteobacteria bacterium]MCW5744025.1 GNAT family N-acetyltransferase [Alphaproteobacteria bacterium]
MTSISVRPARLEDAATLARIYVETWRDTYAGVLPDQMLVGMSEMRHAAAWTHELRASDRFGDTLAAELPNDGIVGLSTVGATRRGPGGFVDGGEVYRLYVSPGFQNRGVGRALMLASFDWMLARRLDAAMVWVVAQNPARFFYERLGGIRLGERTEQMGGTAVHELAYGWNDLKAARERLKSSMSS